MNLDELQSVRDRERQTDKLQQLRESFYADAGSFIQQLRDERERAAERAEDPFDAPEVSQLSDEIDTAEQTVEAIYEKRVGKIVKAASFAAADLPAEVDGMTAEEQVLFDSLVDDIKTNRERVLATLAGEDGATDATGGKPAVDAVDAAGDADPEADVSAADLMGGGSDSAPSTGGGATGERVDGHEPPPPEPGEPPARGASGSTASADDAESGSTDQPSPDPGAGRGREQPVDATASGADPTGSDTAPGGVAEERPVRKDGGTGATAASAESGPSTAIDRETVRITEDVDTFVGSDDRDYDLGPNDVVTLPATNATLLVERDAAEKLD